MPIDWENLRDLVIALAIIGAISLGYSLLSAGSAHAQIAVSDAATEASTAQTASELSQTNQTLNKDLQENTQTAQSVTTPGGAGLWQSNAGYLASAEQFERRYQLVAALRRHLPRLGSTAAECHASFQAGNR